MPPSPDSFGGDPRVTGQLPFNFSEVAAVTRSDSSFTRAPSKRAQLVQPLSNLVCRDSTNSYLDAWRHLKLTIAQVGFKVVETRACNQLGETPDVANDGK